MNKNTLLFILLSSLILMGASILQSNRNPPTPDPNTAVMDVDAGDVVDGDQAVETDVAANQLTEDAAGDEDSSLEKQQEPADPETADPVNAPDQPSDIAADVTPESPDGSESEVSAAQQDPNKLISIGSVASDSRYRYLLTVDTRGGAIRRLELNFPMENNHPKYRDFETKGAYIGELDLVPNSEGLEVRVVGHGTPAAAAGIKVGDQIKTIDDVDVASASSFSEELVKTKPGTPIELTIVRDGKPTTVSVTPSRKPIELIRPEPDQLEPGNFGDGSFLTTLRELKDIANWPEIDAAMRTGNWNVESVDGNSIRLSYTLPQAALAKTGLSGPLQLIKTYTVPQLSQEDLRDTSTKTFHLKFDVEIKNQSNAAQKIGLEIDGPWGTPSETWWYQNKIHGDTWAIGSIAGARDVSASSPEESFIFSGGPEIVKNKLSDEPEHQWIFDSNKRDLESRTVKFIGVDTQYFNVSMIPVGGDPFVCYSALAVPAQVEIPDDNAKFQKLVDCSFQLFKDVELRPGQSFKQSFEIFSGPKEPGLLDTYGLVSNRTFGWFAWFSKPLCWLLKFFYDWTFQLGYGIPIIILTVIVRSFMIPISRKVAVNAQMMQHLQPQMKEINDKYAEDFEKKAQAQRALFKKYKYNPLSGCMMMPLQLPIFIGLYRGLSVDIALRDQPLIPGLNWCTNLAAPDQLFYWGDWMPNMLGGETGWLGPYFNLLPVITCVLFLLQQKLFTPPATDEQGEMMQKVMKYMMLFMAVMFFKVPSGLCLYFITSSLWSILERKMLPKPKLDTSSLSALDLDGMDAEEKKKQEDEIARKLREKEQEHEKTIAEKKRIDRERKKRLKQKGV